MPFKIAASLTYSHGSKLSGIGTFSSQMDGGDVLHQVGSSDEDAMLFSQAGLFADKEHELASARVKTQLIG